MNPKSEQQLAHEEREAQRKAEYRALVGPLKVYTVEPDRKLTETQWAIHVRLRKTA